MARTYYDTPIGVVEIAATETGIVSLLFTDRTDAELNPEHERLLGCIEQLDEYFEGRRTVFNLFLDFQGTDFQRRVWMALRDIPLGKTASYLDVAKRVQSPEAVRAVGSACSRNQHWLIVPCHRVIGTDGKLTGYAGGLNRKQWLLEHEWGMLHGRQVTLW
ncbi:MAG: methylated-DNA--[protein]-cysteine S-methyltransferase [Bacteroidia bacterium]|nr:methylated-DNA--[protein]-cysteine S-methyltransferase [Bacteroidia bacterium]